MKKVRKKLAFILPLIILLAMFFISKVHSQDTSATADSETTLAPPSGNTNLNTTDTISTVTTNPSSATATNTGSMPTSPTASSTSTTSDPTTNAGTTSTKASDFSNTSDVIRSSTDTVNEPSIKIDVDQDFVTYLIKVRGANRVECYAEREGMGSPYFLGAAKKIQEENREFKADITSKVPNGTYTGFAKIIDGDGSYRTDEVGFSVNRPATNNVSVSNYQVQNQVAQNVETNSQQQKNGETKENQPMSVSSQTSDFEDDFDRDGISNSEEKRLGTNPLQADSDQDGYLDGDELKNGFNPMRFSPGDRSDKIVFQSPKEKGQIDQTYAVENIEMKKDPEKGNTYRLSGKALPNIYLTIYVYSEDPIVVTVKTDENGNWVYDLEKDLENGDHEVYVAMTDNAGKITAKSNPLKFVKTAEAVSVIQEGQDYDLTQPLPSEKRKSNALLYATIVVTLFLAAALALIGFISNQHKEKNENLN